MTSILSRLLTADKPWSTPYPTTANKRASVGPGTSAPALQTLNVFPVNSTSVQPAPRRRRNSRKSQEDTVRFGRVPKREKAKILAAMQKVNASSQEKALSAELEDELRLLTTIVRAHEETCDYTKDKVAPLVEKARTQPVYTHCPPQLACPLNPAPHPLENGGSSRIMEDFSERFSPAIRGVVEFAKRIPGFSFLSQDDQVTLLKAGVFEVLLVRLACMFDSQANSLICLNGQVLRREALHSASNARFLLDSMFDFAERLNALHLADSEVGLFCAVVVIAADRPGLRNTDLVQKIQKKMMDVLQKSVAANHPENPAIFSDLMKKIPDLRTLNTLHSEKLLAYKMEPRNQTASASGGINGISAASTINHSMYATIPHDIWSQYSLITTPAQSLGSEEDNRSTSPGQHSQHGGSTTGSEWSTTDSKDDHDIIGSPRSVGSGICPEDVKSPVRSSSFSSTRSYVNEDVWSAEVPQNGDFHNLPKRQRDNTGSEHGSSSGDEGYCIDSPIKGPVYPKLRRVDSPTDSGIESGKEHGPSTTPTISVCSSPRSTLEEKVKDIMDQEHTEKQEHIEDMPVLKRALQAPPLVNTNMLMDEAYRHHKKFRAVRREVESPSSPASMSLASSHSTLVRTLEQAPRYLSEQQLKRTDLIHNIIMRTETLPGQHISQQQQQQQQQLPHQEMSVQSCGTNGIQMSVSSSFPYNSVPNSSPVPPNYAPNTQQKNMLVCPSGYYIPHGNVSAPIYSTPVSWPFMGQSTAATMTATTTVTSSPVHVHTQFASNNGSEHAQAQNCTLPVTHHQQTSTSLCVSAATNSPQSASPRLMYSSRSPALSSSSPLVINGGLPTVPSPTILSSAGQLENRLVSPTSAQQLGILNDATDSQPLNLSKKLMSPPLLKMES